jgi:hypothetical protein
MAKWILRPFMWIVIAFPNLAFAQSANLQVTPEYAYEEPFTGFFARCPQQIIYRSILNTSLATYSSNGDALIVLDHSLQFPAQRYEHNFLASHECAHHLLGDTSPAGIHARKTIRGAISQQELRADCWAAEFMGVLGQDHDIKRMAEGFYRRGRSFAGGGYPSGYDRAVTIQRCWRKGRNGRLPIADMKEDQD